jgi:hypothetical protein
MISGNEMKQIFNKSSFTLEIKSKFVVKIKIFRKRTQIQKSIKYK